jgi:DNA-binding CsgD family transcriptional regulator
MSCQSGEHAHARSATTREEDIAKLDRISVRQREVLARIAEGHNTKEIAAAMGITVKTVEAHRLRLMHRLQIDNVAGLVRFAIRSGLVSLD